MKIKFLMSTDVITVDMDSPLSKVKRIFELNEFHHLLVLEKNKLVGVVSDRDLLKSISPNVDSDAATDKDLATLNKRVHQIMSRKLVCLDEESSIRDAIKLFNENKISCLPIINEKHKPVGILSWRDIMKALAKVSG